MSNLSVKEMISAGVHFGHQSKYWNPKMRPFIFTTYKKLHIINLDKSIERFKSASTFIEKLAKNNSKILFVGTKRAAREIIQKHATDVQMPYVNNRWLGGILTNFDTAKKSIQKLENLHRHLVLKPVKSMENRTHALFQFLQELCMRTGILVMFQYGYITAQIRYTQAGIKPKMLMKFVMN